MRTYSQIPCIKEYSTLTRKELIRDLTTAQYTIQQLESKLEQQRAEYEALCSILKQHDKEW